MSHFSIGQPNPKALIKTKASFITAASLILACFAAAAFGGANKIDVRASCPKTKAFIAEPLIIDISVANVGGDEVEVINPAYARTIYMVDPAGVPQSIGDLWLHMLEEIPKVKIHAGETSRHRIVVPYCILHAEDGKTADNPLRFEGNYSARARIYIVGGGAVDSAAVSILVVKAEGRAKDATELFRGRQQGMFMLGSSKVSIEPFEKLAKDYPDTPYGQYARFYLAKQLIGPNVPSSKHDPSRAALTFEALSKEQPPFPLVHCYS